MPCLFALVLFDIINWWSWWLFVDCVVAKEGDVERYATWFPNVRRTGIVCEKYSREREFLGGKKKKKKEKFFMNMECFFMKYV